MLFTAENILLVGSILLFVSIIVGKTGYRFGVPALLLFLVVGMLFGSDGLGLQFHNAKEAQFIGMVALSIILFSGGMDTKFTEIKPILSPGIVLSTLGVLLTALFTGLFIWWLSGMSWTNIHLPLITSLLLASTMSSTDSASVFAILRSQKMNLKHNLRPMLELESGSNDPMAYMLTIVLIQFIQSSGMGVSQISDWAISSQIENGLYPSTITIGEGNTNYTNKATKYTVTNGAISRGEEKNMLSLETPDGQACPEITYMSSDENIISIDTNGKMKAVGAVGQTATVLAKYDGTTFAQINMTIGATVVNDDAYYVNPIVGDVTYTGEGLKPAIEVYKNGTKIEDTTEYTVDYANNTNVGVATATVKVGETEIGTANFNIVRATPTITISPSVTAQRGAGTVTLTATKPEKATGAVTVKCDNGITVYEKKDGVYTAALPNATRTYTFTASYAGDSNYNAVENVTCTVDVTRKKSSSSSSDTSAPTYGVSTGKTENGEISVTPAKAEAGETVTIKATPDSGYQLDKMTVKDKNNSTVKLKKVDENEYTFTMPVGKVSVDATFVQKDAADDSNAAEAGKTIKLQIGSRIVNVDNEAVIYDAAPVIRNDRTLVPIRIITEALGGKVDWNGATKEVTLSINDKEIKMTIGKTLEKYGVAPVIIDGRTFVPVRFVADELGANVAWDDATKTVTIKTAR